MVCISAIPLLERETGRLLGPSELQDNNRPLVCVRVNIFCCCLKIVSSLIQYIQPTLSRDPIKKQNNNKTKLNSA